MASAKLSMANRLKGTDQNVWCVYVYCIKKAFVHWVLFTLRKEIQKKLLGKWEIVAAEL